jgi:hypothetical protein
MTVSASAVFAATCSQVFTGWHYEFTFSNDTVTALDLELWCNLRGERAAREQGVTPAPQKRVDQLFRGAVVVRWEKILPLINSSAAAAVA